jgi:hypothetical protein
MVTPEGLMRRRLAFWPRTPRLLGCLLSLAFIAFPARLNATPVLYWAEGAFMATGAPVIDVSGYVVIESEPVITDDDPRMGSISYDIVEFNIVGDEFSFTGTDGDLLILTYTYPEYVAASPEWWHLYGEGSITSSRGLFESPEFLDEAGNPLPWSRDTYSQLAPMIELQGGWDAASFRELRLREAPEAVPVPEPSAVLLVGLSVTMWAAWRKSERRRR